MKQLQMMFCKLNFLYRSIVSFITGNEFKPNILHPQYLHTFFLKKYIFKAAKKYANGKLVDLGCGTKPYFYLIKEFIDSYLGIDLFNARKPVFFVDKDKKKPDIFADVKEIPLKDGFCDVVLCSQVIEHIDNYKLLLNESNRILKKDGIIILTCPQTYPIHDKSNDFYRFTANGLKYILKSSGFDVCECFRHGGFFVEQALMVNIYLNNNLFLEGEGVNFKRIILSFFKIILMPLILMSNFLVNSVAFLLDKTDWDKYFTHNYTVVAKKNKL